MQHMKTPEMLSASRCGKVFGALALVCMGIAQAQVGALTEAERKVPGWSPPGANAGTGVQPSTDPRDFSGSWRVDMGPRPGGGAPGSGPAGAAPPNPNPDLNPAGNRGATGQLPARILCLPQEPLYTGLDGPTTIVQTPELINWAAEEMHHQRRIYLTGALPTNPKPSYLGVSVGHWEGDALVVETVGLRSQKPGTKMIERWSKSSDHRKLSISVSYLDAQGKSTPGRNLSLSWANGIETLEWICEDFNEEWLPGGAAYEDQVGK